MKRKSGWKPPPFKRPAIDMDRHGRVWKTVLASELSEGDVVQDRGLVEYLQTDTFDKGMIVTIWFLNGDDVSYHTDEEVYAFVKRN